MAVPVEPAARLNIVGEGLVGVTDQVLVDTRVSVSGEVAVVVALAHREILDEVIVGHAVAVQDRNLVRKGNRVGVIYPCFVGVTSHVLGQHKWRVSWSSKLAFDYWLFIGMLLVCQRHTLRAVLT